MAIYPCYRHIFEKFGSNSPLVFIVVRLLKLKDQTEYLQLCHEIDAELKIYIKV